MKGKAFSRKFWSHTQEKKPHPMARNWPSELKTNEVPCTAPSLKNDCCFFVAILQINT